MKKAIIFFAALCAVGFIGDAVAAGAYVCVKKYSGCEPGFIHNPGAGTCVDALLGCYRYAVGATTTTIPCPEGWYCENGAYGGECGVGYYCPPGSTTKYGEQVNCTSLSPGYTNDSKDCLGNSLGSGSKCPCDKNYYCEGGKGGTTGINGAVNKVGQTCKYGQNRLSGARCGTDYNTDKVHYTDPTPCPLGSSSDAGTTTIKNCYWQNSTSFTDLNNGAGISLGIMVGNFSSDKCNYYRYP